MNTSLSACFTIVAQAFMQCAANAANVMPVWQNDTVANAVSFQDTFGHQVGIGTYNAGTGVWSIPSGSISVGATFTGGIVSIGGSPITGPSGTLAFTIAGTSGGIPYFSSGTGWASSTVLSAGQIVQGGGAGAAPSTFTLGGDCTLASPNITCTKTGGIAFGTLATLNAAPAGTLTGATLASNVLASSLTSLGNLASLVVNGTTATKGIVSAGTESVADYINTYGYGAGSAAYIISQADGVSSVGATFATRTKNWPGGAAAPIGAIHWGFADMPTASGSPPLWSGYFETRKFPGTTGLTVTDEHDITNFVSGLSKLDPYAGLVSGTLAANLWLASGGGCSATAPCYNPFTGLTNISATSAQVAIGIEDNQGDYLGGIEFGYNAIHGVDGKTQGVFGPAITMAMGQTLDWASCSNVTAPYPTNCAANNITARIGTQQSTSALAESIIFYDNTLLFQTATNGEFSVLFNNSDTEGLQASGDSAGNTPSISATSGSVANVNLGLKAKGTGAIVLVSSPLVSTGTVPTNTGSCPINTQLGGPISGSFKANGACAGGTYILSMPAVTNGYSCVAQDLTTTTNTVKQSGTLSTTSVTFTATTTNADLVTFHCIGF